MLPRIVGPGRVTIGQRAAAATLSERIEGCTADPLSPLDRRQLWVAVGKRAVVGFATVGEAHDAQGRTVRAWFLSCGVSPEARGHGIQRALIKARLAYLRGVARRQGAGFVVETYARNPTSRVNLEACGFEEVRVDDEGFTHYQAEVHP